MFKKLFDWVVRLTLALAAIISSIYIYFIWNFKLQPEIPYYQKFYSIATVISLVAIVVFILYLLVQFPVEEKRKENPKLDIKQ